MAQGSAFSKVEPQEERQLPEMAKPTLVSKPAPGDSCSWKGNWSLARDGPQGRATSRNTGANWEQVHDSKWARWADAGVCSGPGSAVWRRVVPSIVDLLYSEQDLNPSPVFCLLWPQNTKFWFSSKMKNIKTRTLTWFSFSSIACILAILVKWAKSRFGELRSSSQLGKTSDFLGSSVLPSRTDPLCSVSGS